VSCPVWVETFPSRRECGRHVPHFPALPYFPEQATGALGGLVLTGARDPIAFFAYPGQPSWLLPAGAARCVLADPAGNVHAGL
jgi:acetolactate synthase-1/2/3 large subunit